MVEANAAFAWHLKRGQKFYGPISNRELRLLAELGHLRPDDLVWRSGLGTWISPSSVTGIALQQGSSRGKIFLLRLREAYSAVLNELRQLTLSARQHAHFVKGSLQHTYNRAVFRWPNFNLVEAVPGRPHFGVLTGLLMIAVSLPALDFAMQSAGGNAQLAKSLGSKFQGRPSSELATPLWTPVYSQPAVGLSEVQVFSVSNGHPPGGFVVASTDTSVPQPGQHHTEPTQTAGSQSEAAETSDDVPLPTRKPDKPSVKAQAKMATPKRTAQRQKRKETRPMQFGNIGYNYIPQQ